MQTYLSDILHVVSQALLIPDIILLLAFIGYALFSIGSIISEHFTEHQHFKVTMPKFLAALMKAEEDDIPQVITDSGLLKRQKKALLTVFDYRTLPGDALIALIKREVGEEEARYDRITARNNMAARVAPMLGLMGTLIPLGPGIQALGKADTAALSSSLLIAFDTTVAGLVVAAVCLVIGKIRSTWYNDYMGALDSAMATMLEKIEQMRAEGKITVQEPTDYAFLYETSAAEKSEKKRDENENAPSKPARELVKPEPSTKPKPKPATQAISQVAPDSVTTTRVQEQHESTLGARMGAAVAAVTASASEIVAPVENKASDEAYAKPAARANADTAAEKPVDAGNARADAHADAAKGATAVESANAGSAEPASAEAAPVVGAQQDKAQSERALFQVKEETQAEPKDTATPVDAPAVADAATRVDAQQTAATRTATATAAATTTSAAATTAAATVAATASAAATPSATTTAAVVEPLGAMGATSQAQAVSAAAQESTSNTQARAQEPANAAQSSARSTASAYAGAARTSWYQPQQHSSNKSEAAGKLDAAQVISANGAAGLSGWNPSGSYRHAKTNEDASSEAGVQKAKADTHTSDDDSDDLYSIDFTLE